jgi:hypothetical protein
MKILKRLLAVISIVPFMILFLIEVIFYTLRWIISGKHFPDFPISFDLWFKLAKIK